MNIIVSAAAGRESGALMIYQQFLSHLREHVGKNRYYLFVDPDMPAPEIPGVTYFKVDLRSMRSRILFDNFRCRKYLERYGVKPDKVISLQNTGVKSLSYLPQLIYYHQPAPFYPIRWNPLKPEERKMFLYKHIYPFFVQSSINRWTHVVVQIPFIRDGFLSRFRIDRSHVHTLFPDVKYIDREQIDPYVFSGEAESHFVYPATGWVYKNHRLLLDALGILRQRNPKLFASIRVHFTVTAQTAPALAEIVKEQGMEEVVLLEGSVSHEMFLRKFAACKALLFPSRMETLGLPLLEAAALGLPVLAGDLEYAHNVLDGYVGVEFLPLEDPVLWADRIAALAATPLCRHPYKAARQSSWPEFFRIVSEM